MTDTTISDAVVFPQDDGTGVPDGNEDFASAGLFAQLAEAIGGSYLGDGISLTNIDTTNNQVDVTAGHGFIQQSGVAAQSGAQSSYDTNLPNSVSILVVLPTNVSNLDLTSSSSNDLWLAMNPSSQDEVYIRHGAGLSAPSDPNVKIGTADTSTGITTDLNRGGANEFDSVDVNKQLNIPAYDDVSNAPSNQRSIVVGTGDGSSTENPYWFDSASGSYVNLMGGLFGDAFLSANAVADNQKTYSSIQTAIDNATNYVKVGPGTFTENITITKDDIHLDLSNGTTIDGGTSAPAITVSAANNFTVTGGSIITTAGNSTPRDCIRVEGSTPIGTRIAGVEFPESSGDGVNIQSGSIHRVSHCRAIGVDVTGFSLHDGTFDCSISDCFSEDCGLHGYYIDGDKGNITSSVSLRSGDDGVHVTSVASRNVITAGNMITNNTDHGVFDDGANTTVTNNIITGNATNLALGANATGNIHNHNQV